MVTVTVNCRPGFIRMKRSHGGIDKDATPKGGIWINFCARRPSHVRTTEEGRMNLAALGSGDAQALSRPAAATVMLAVAPDTYAQFGGQLGGDLLEGGRLAHLVGRSHDDIIPMVGRDLFVAELFDDHGRHPVLA